MSNDPKKGVAQGRADVAVALVATIYGPRTPETEALAREIVEDPVRGCRRALLGFLVDQQRITLEAMVDAWQVQPPKRGS